MFWIQAGRFQPYHLGHLKVLDILHKYYKEDNDPYKLLIVAIIFPQSRKLDFKNPFPYDITFEIVEKATKKYKPLLVRANNLFPVTILEEVKKHVYYKILDDEKRALQNTVLAVGKDRDIIEKQAKKYGFNVIIVPRAVEDISATKIRESLLKNDYKTFNHNMPNEVNDLEMFKKLKDYVVQWAD
jgi:FAD synthase